MSGDIPRTSLIQNLYKFRTKQSTLYKNVMHKETLLNVDGDFVVYTTNFINP